MFSVTDMSEWNFHVSVSCGFSVWMIWCHWKSHTEHTGHCKYNSVYVPLQIAFWVIFPFSSSFHLTGICFNVEFECTVSHFWQKECNFLSEDGDLGRCLVFPGLARSSNEWKILEVCHLWCFFCRVCSVTLSPLGVVSVHCLFLTANKLLFPYLWSSCSYDRDHKMWRQFSHTSLNHLLCSGCAEIESTKYSLGMCPVMITIRQSGRIFYDTERSGRALIIYLSKQSQSIDSETLLYTANSVYYAVLSTLCGMTANCSITQ